VSAQPGEDFALPFREWIQLRASLANSVKENQMKICFPPLIIGAELRLNIFLILFSEFPCFHILRKLRDIPHILKYHRGLILRLPGETSFALLCFSGGLLIVGLSGIVTPSKCSQIPLESTCERRYSVRKEFFYPNPYFPAKIFMLDDYTKHQQGIIKRYYDNLDKIQVQKLGELVSELYLSEGKKRQKLWQSAVAAMQKLEIPQTRIDHLVNSNDPALLAQLVKELQD
jgi:hypothetical protein